MKELCMKKVYALLGMFLCVFATLDAQPETVHATVSAAATVNNVYAAFGQPFYQQISNGDVELSYGVSQAQLDIVEVADETCENVAYTDNGFDIPTSVLSLGTTDYELYTNDAPLYGYDRITKLALTVWPIYATEASETYHGALPVIPGSELQDGTDYQVHEGINVINYSSVHNCDSVVTLYVYYCPPTVKDADSNLYYTVLLDNYCWTQSNLRTTHYTGDAHEDVPMALIYNSGDMNEAEMEATFGRLYTWYSSVHIPEGSDALPALDDDGFVRGICPAGWHIPTDPERVALQTHTGDELRTPDYWILGGGVNSSGFTMYPAGIHDASHDRFEGLFTMTRHWFVATTSEPVALCTEYYCDTFVPTTLNPFDAYSVRCVKNY